jgi:hypothetical protein
MWLYVNLLGNCLDIRGVGNVNWTVGGELQEINGKDKKTIKTMLGVRTFLTH